MSSQDVAVFPWFLYTLMGPDPLHTLVLHVALQMLSSSFAIGWGALLPQKHLHKVQQYEFRQRIRDLLRRGFYSKVIVIGTMCRAALNRQSISSPRLTIQKLNGSGVTETTQVV